MQKRPTICLDMETTSLRRDVAVSVGRSVGMVVVLNQMMACTEPLSERDDNRPAWQSSYGPKRRK